MTTNQPTQLNTNLPQRPTYVLAVIKTIVGNLILNGAMNNRMSSSNKSLRDIYLEYGMLTGYAIGPSS